MRKNPNEDNLTRYKFRANSLDKHARTVFGWKKAKAYGESFLYTNIEKIGVAAKVDGQSIEQNTGYIDANGNPVFEGDYLLVRGILVKVFSTENGFIVRQPRDAIDIPLEQVSCKSTIANEFANIFESMDISIITVVDNREVETYYAEKP